MGGSSSSPAINELASSWKLGVNNKRPCRLLNIVRGAGTTEGRLGYTWRKHTMKILAREALRIFFFLGNSHRKA